MAWCTNHLRDSQAWSDAGLPMQVKSDDATKHFDAVLRQLISWMNVEELGGIEGSLKAMNEADPDFVLGRVLSLGLQLVDVGGKIKDPEFLQKIDVLYKEMNTSKLTKREKSHIQAVKLFSEGKVDEASEVWENILSEHPTDILALILAYYKYFVFRNAENLKHTMEMILPHWNKGIPMFSHINGMMVYALEEKCEFTEALRYGQMALEANPKDIWAIHGMGHCYEMTSQTEKGLKHLESYSDHWKDNKFSLVVHTLWHWALFHIQNGDIEAALNVLDDEMFTRANAKSLANISDITSLLFRMEMQGVNVGKERWNKVIEMTKPFSSLPLQRGFHAVHLMFSYVQDNDEEVKAGFLRNIEEYISDCELQSLSQDNMKFYGLPVVHAVQAYHDKNYDQVFNLMYPIRNKLYTLGNSNAQRDVFTQMLINASILSPVEAQRAKSSVLLNERSELYPSCHWFPYSSIAKNL